MSEILKLAFAELGTKEIAGSDHNDRIVAYSKESGINGINDDETPWCSVFVNWVCHKLKLEKSGKANARSWVHIGTKTDSPMPGDIVVFWRESPNSWKGHVGFFLGYSSDLSQVFCLGGNQGNAVSIAAYDASKILQFTRVSSKSISSVAKPTLKRGAMGAEVEKLQIALNELGYNCGDPDGDFGGKTFQALKLFQANNRLKVDGEYGKKSAAALASLLQQ